MKRQIKISFNSPVVLSFTFFCLVVTALGVFTGFGVTQKFFAVYRAPLTDPFTYLRMFTHVLGHNGWAHFIGNASYLLLLGPMLEEKYGSKLLIETILFTALVTGLINFIFFPSVALCGASGVVFAFIILASFTGFKSGEIPLTFILVAAIFIGQQVYDGIVLTDNISNMAHIVGGFVGYIMNRKG